MVPFVKSTCKHEDILLLGSETGESSWCVAEILRQAQDDILSEVFRHPELVEGSPALFSRENRGIQMHVDH